MIKYNMTKCLNCDKDTDKRFCCKKCYQRWAYYKDVKKARARRMKYYYSTKNNPGVREKLSSQFKRWREKNHKKHNDFMRIYMRARSKRLYHERRADGLCGRCGQNSSTMAECDECKSRRKSRRLSRKLCNLKHGIPPKPKVLGILPTII